MPLTILPYRSVDLRTCSSPAGPGRCEPLALVLVNNMPDAALETTAAQFSRLLAAAASRRPVALRLAYLPEVPRGPQAQAHLLERRYWPIDAALERPLDALIVTGLEPRAERLADEPYWGRLARLVDWAQTHVRSSIWSCLAAHAAVLHLDGIERRRLARKRFGVFEHARVQSHPLLQAARPPFANPHSRWNDLPIESLRAAGYAILTASEASGADLFVKDGWCLHVFFQGHPEYDATTLLKEYRRDVSRFLRQEQGGYPDAPSGYFSQTAIAALTAFRDRALQAPSADLIESFPLADLCAGLGLPWGANARTIYRNWLEALAARRAAEPTRAAVRL